MLRRRGQSGNLIMQSGQWRVRFRLDEPGTDKRTQMSVIVGPIVYDKHGNPKPASLEIQRMAREIVEQSGANSEERFNCVVLGEVTFREQARIYLDTAAKRKRNPLRDTVSIEGPLSKWAYPAIGDMPLRLIDNLAVRKVVETMSPLSPRSINKYVQYIQQVVASLKAPNGEPIHKRTWDAETMDLPIVERFKQKRPSFNSQTVSELIVASTGQEQALYVLLGATGMRISEALALEVRHFINDGRTVKVEQQVGKNKPKVVPYLKTAAAKRQIDLHPDVANFFQQYNHEKSGLLFHTANGTPHLYNNLASRWLVPRLNTDGRWHGFRRFRETWLRGQRCLEDINNYWAGHSPANMSALYSHLHEELQLRLAEAERVGYGFTLPIVAPNAPKIVQQEQMEVAA